MVRALVLGCFGQKKIKTKIDLKDTARKRIQLFSIINGVVLWTADVCSWAAFTQHGPVVLCVQVDHQIAPYQEWANLLVFSLCKG